jgi:hypothetical protein
MLSQNRDHRRLSRQLHRLQPAVAEEPAGPGDANEVAEVKLPKHVYQQLQRKALHEGAS